MELLLWILIVLLGVAVLIDQIMTEEAVRRWRTSTRDLRRRIDELDIDVAITTANRWFCDLFDAIYGTGFWSRRRFVRSYYSSLLALSTITLLLGWETTTFSRTNEGTHIIVGLAVAVFLLNPCADYFSLQETRWILGLSKNSSLGRLLLLGILDLVATLAIYVFFFSVIGFSFASAIGEDFTFKALYVRDKGLLFLLSTFFTSALWFVYIASVLCTRVMKRNSRVLRILLDTVGESDAPARTTAGIMAIMLIAVYGVARGFTWVIGI